MKNILGLLYFTVLFSCHPADAQHGELSVKAFAEKLTTQKVQLLDVRTAGEFQTGHLKNALQADWLNKEQFAQRVQFLDKSKPVLVYCASGVRSAAAAKWLLDIGFTDVQNLKGGLLSWKSAGEPLESVSDKPQMTPEQYASKINSGNVILVDFGAEWCPPCKTMEPILHKLQKELPGKYQMLKVDGGNDIEVMKAQKVSALPVFIIYKNGKEVWRKEGVATLEELKSGISI